MLWLHYAARQIRYNSYWFYLRVGSLKKTILSASSRVGIQWKSRFRRLPHPVLQSRIKRGRSFSRHHGPTGKGVHYRGLRRVDGVRGQSSGCQWHWIWTLEPSSPWQDQGVWWGRLSVKVDNIDSLIDYLIAVKQYPAMLQCRPVVPQMCQHSLLPPAASLCGGEKSKRQTAMD